MSFLAFILTLAGASCFYMASRHQRWRSAPLPPATAAPLGTGILILGLAAWVQATQLLTGIFIFITLLTLLWTLLPFVGLRGRR